MPHMSVRTLVLLLPLGALAACANPRDEVALSAPAAATPAAAGDVRTVAGYQVAGDGKECAFAIDVRDWRAVDREHIILDTYTRSYLLRVSGLCNSDPNEQLSIGIGSSAGSVCPGDPLVVAGQRCSIREMWQVSKPLATAIAD